MAFVSSYYINTLCGQVSCLPIVWDSRWCGKLDGRGCGSQPRNPHYTFIAPYVGLVLAIAQVLSYMLYTLLK